MTTPANFGTYDRIIRDGYRDAGYLGTGDDPSGEQLAEGRNRIMDLITFWQTKGIKLWQQVDFSIPLVANKATYSIFSGGDVNIQKPMRILTDGYFLDNSTPPNSRTISMLSKNQYMALGNKTQTGQINQYLVDKLQDRINVTFWLVPDTIAALGTAHLLIQQPATTIVGLTDTINFPQEWYLALRWGFADDISTGQPQSVIDRCEKKAMQYFKAVEDWDVEDASTSFQPDTQQGSGYWSDFTS